MPPQRPVAATSAQSSSVPASFDDKAALRAFLEAHGIDTIAWGAGKAKRMEDLLQELHDNESSLQLVGRKAYRWVGVVKLIVRTPELPDHHLACYEQQMPDGRKRPRNVLLSEKKARDEPAARAALRAIREELASVKALWTASNRWNRRTCMLNTLNADPNSNADPSSNANAEPDSNADPDSYATPSLPLWPKP